MYKIIGKDKKTGRELQWGKKTFVRMEAQAFADVLNERDKKAEYRIEKV